jgi:hypothetical protein
MQEILRIWSYTTHDAHFSPEKLLSTNHFLAVQCHIMPHLQIHVLSVYESESYIHRGRI